LRRGEITALRWKSVDLDNERPNLQVVASTEQTDAGNIGEKHRNPAAPDRSLFRQWPLKNYGNGEPPLAEELLRSASVRMTIRTLSQKPKTIPSSRATLLT